MVKHPVCIICLLVSYVGLSQPFDTSSYNISAEMTGEADRYFTTDPVWRGGDGASSIDLENEKVLWLFSDSFICTDSSRLRINSDLIRNSIAIQEGYNLQNAPVTYYWNTTKKKPHAFFTAKGKFWYWTGHGIMLRDKLLIFLMNVRSIKSGLGFEIFGWDAVLVSNPLDDPTAWKTEYIEGSETYGLIAGSSAVLKDDKYVYAFGAVEPATHEAYVLRWTIDDACMGHLNKPEWGFNGKWKTRNSHTPVPEPLFIGATEYSVHYDSALEKFIQVQSYGFGEGKIGIRMSDRIEAGWTEPYVVYTPEYPGVRKPLIYAAKAHPELLAEGIYITYNVNSADFGELLENHDLYFPKFVLLNLSKRKKP